MRRRWNVFLLVVVGNYVVVQKWKPSFCSSRATTNTTCVSVRIPDLPMEFYNQDLLFSVSKYLSTPG